MKLIADPAVAVKIAKMQERVCWQHPVLQARGIDQTRLVVDDDRSDSPDFSFLVIGDSGTGQYRGDSPQRRVMEQLLAHGQGSSFVLHTGDVVYLVGSQEQYFDNFIYPYREWLVNGERPQQIAYDQMVFKLPMFTVPGNHDYYDLPWCVGLIAQATLPIRHLFQRQLDLDLGWHGSNKGDAYAQAFLDYLRRLTRAELQQHVETHYTADFQGQRCLRYQPGVFTRLPNRYYQFRQGGIDFFALDSNTLNTPLPIPKDKTGRLRRRQLKADRQALINARSRALAAALRQYESRSEDDDSDTYTKVEQLDEQILDIEKQLADGPDLSLDIEQLVWLKQRLIESWLTPEVRGRVLFFHHPPYVTEASKWYQGQTLAIRRHLRQVLDQVQQAVGNRATGRPLVDLILNGHAHCLEVLKTGDTGHADSHINCVVCGGSGFSLRRQRPEGLDLWESVDGESERCVARSQLFIGRHGQGAQKHRPYSGLRIDVQAGTPPKFILRPLIAERFQRQWYHYPLAPIRLSQGVRGT